MIRLAIALALLLALCSAAFAQDSQVIAACGTPPATYAVGSVRHSFMDQNGNLCTSSGGGVASSVTQSGTWTVQPGNTANTTPWLAQPVPQSTGGMSIFSKIVANNTTSFAIDASPGTLYAIIATSNSTTPAYIKMYNTAQGSVTCGTPTPVDRIMIPANATTATGGGIVWSLPLGAAYGTAITACVTTGIADNDTGAPAASTYLVSFYFK